MEPSLKHKVLKCPPLLTIADSGSLLMDKDKDSLIEEGGLCLLTCQADMALITICSVSFRDYWFIP